MNKTQIEWVKNPGGTQGVSWNPITGCLNNCSYCYARRLANTRLKERYLANPCIALPSHLEGKDLHSEDVWEYQKDPFYPRFWEDRLFEPADTAHLTKNYNLVEHRQKAKGIFVCDMSDLFGIGIPEDWTKRVLDAISISKPTHRFYLLTKQPQNLIKFSPFPDNAWVGQTLTNQDDADSKFNDFAKVVASTKYVSLEPLLGRIDISAYLPDRDFKNFPGTTFENPEGVERYDLGGAIANSVDWIIIGAQTKPYKPPKWEWVAEIIEACDKADIPVFLKNNLGLPKHSADGAFPFYKGCPSGTRELRQEMPNGLGKK